VDLQLQILGIAGLPKLKKKDRVTMAPPIGNPVLILIRLRVGD
jgi:hypothetical protein